MKLTIMVNRASIKASKGVKEAKAIDYTIVNVATGETAGNALMRTKGLEGLEIKKGDALSVLEVASAAIKAGHTATARTRKMIIDLETSKAYLDYVKAVDNLAAIIKDHQGIVADIIWHIDHTICDKIATINKYMATRRYKSDKPLSEGVLHMLSQVRARLESAAAGGAPVMIFWSADASRGARLTPQGVAGIIADAVYCHQLRAARRAAASARKAALQAAVDIIGKQGYIA